MKKGFTLIELLCCISIIAIISSITLYIPAKKIFQNTKFETVSNELLLDMKNAKMRAVSHGRIQVLFKDDGYLIIDISNTNNMIIKDVKFESNIKFDRVNSTVPVSRVIEFTQLGGVSPYPCTIAICDDDGNKSLITIKVGSFTIDYKR